MNQQIGVKGFKAPNEPVRRVDVAGWQVELLPKGRYETLYVPEHSIIGFAFEAQSGMHAFCSDKRIHFKAKPNGLAYVQSGCDVYSRSTEGGEYLRITCPTDIRDCEVHQHPFSDEIDKVSIDTAYRLRRMMLNVEEIDLLACEQSLTSVEERVVRKLSCDVRIRDGKAWNTAARLKLIDEIIEDRLDTKLTVLGIASELGLSAAFFSREFRKAVGRSPYEYVVDRRIARARQMIQLSTSDLSSIALDCGFTSHSHMSAVFRDRLGVTPSDLRRCERRLNG